MSDQVPNFVEYICQYAQPGNRDLERNEALAYLIDQQLSGLLPRLTLGSSLRTWQEFWEVAPKHLRPALARLWKEYLRLRKTKVQRRRWAKKLKLLAAEQSKMLAQGEHNDTHRRRKSAGY